MPCLPASPRSSVWVCRSLICTKTQKGIWQCFAEQGWNNAPSKLKWLAVNDIGTAVLFEKILRWHILARLTSDCSKLDALAEDLSLCSEESR
jgi:hypothetical protein